MKRGKRLKRTFPKRWTSSTIKASPGPTKGWANEYYLRARSQGKDHPPPKQIRQKESEHYLYFALPYKEGFKLKLYFFQENFFFIEQDLNKDWLRKSIVYGSRDRAMWAYDKQEISWKFAGPSSDPQLAPLPS